MMGGLAVIDGVINNTNLQGRTVYTNNNLTQFPADLVKIPSGNCPFAPTPVMTGVGGFSVTVAVALPFGPVAVTASVPVEVMAPGAVYMPAEVMDPFAAAQPVAPADVNCWVAPRFKETVTGAMVCGF